MPYYECRNCLQISDKLKIKYESEPMIHSVQVCPNCDSVYIDRVFVNELNIIIFDDKINCKELSSLGKSLPCKYDVEFTNLHQSHISRTPGGYDYRMIFHVRDFNIMNSFELARYIMEFIIETSKDRKHVCLKYTDETINLGHTNPWDARKLFEQKYLLQQNLQRCQNFIRS